MSQKRPTTTTTTLSIALYLGGANLPTLLISQGARPQTAHWGACSSPDPARPSFARSLALRSPLARLSLAPRSPFARPARSLAPRSFDRFLALSLASALGRPLPRPSLDWDGITD